MAVLGNDLGTANSVAFLSDQGASPKAIWPVDGPTVQGQVFPSYVEFDQVGELLYAGKRAYDNYLSGISNPIIWGGKRLIGISFDAAQREMRHLDYAIERAEDGTVLIPVGSKRYTPVDIAFMILNKIKQDAAKHGVTKIDRVVVSHPAYFDSERRKSTLQAAKKAFPELAEVADAIVPVPEPLAAALGYGLEIAPGTRRVVCVIDLGAGTLDIVAAVISPDAEGRPQIDLSDPAQGKAAFGGIDIDGLLIDWIIKENKLTDFGRVRREKQAKDTRTMKFQYEFRTLRSELELIKIRLSYPKMKPQAFQRATYNGDPIDATLTREKIEEVLDAPLSPERVAEFIGYTLNDEKMAQILQALERFHPGERRESLSFLDVLRLTIMNALSKDGFTAADVDTLILVGGPMNMPCIRKAIRQVFEENKTVIEQVDKMDKEDPDILKDRFMQCVARGASLYVGDRGRDEKEEKEKPETSGSDFHYAVLKKQEDGKDGKTHLIYYDGSEIKRREMVPTKKLVDRNMRLSSDKEIPIVLLEGLLDLAVADKDAKLWKRSAPLFFEPVYDKENIAHFTITLELNKAKIAAITVNDKVSHQNYTFEALPMLEELAPDKYCVEVEKDDEPVTLERMKTMLLIAGGLSLSAVVWLDQKHSLKAEENRPRISELAGKIPLHIQNLNNAIKQCEARGMKDDDVVAEQQSLQAYWLAYKDVEELDRLLKLDKITPEEMEKARNKANFIRQDASILEDKCKDTTWRQKMRGKRQDLEKSLMGLPRITEPTEDSEIIMKCKHITNSTNELEGIINKVRADLGMPPIKDQ